MLGPRARPGTADDMIFGEKERNRYRLLVDDLMVAGVNGLIRCSKAHNSWTPSSMPHEVAVQSLHMTVQHPFDCCGAYGSSFLLTCGTFCVS